MTQVPKPKGLLDLFPAPEFLLLSTSGIAITDYDIKFVELRREILGNGLRLTHSSQTINPAGAIVLGSINNQAAISSTIKEIADSHKIRYVRATLPDEKAYLFTTTIDWIEPEGIQDAVAFVVEENVPITLDESVFSFEIIKQDQAINEIKLAVSVLPKEVVNTYVTLFESVGITPISFDIESQAIARAITKRGDEHSYLVINLAPGRTGFYVVEGRIVEFSTTLSYGIDIDNATQNLDDLKEEVRKVLTFWSTHTDKAGRPETKIEKIILCGIGSSRKNLVDKLMEGTDIPFELGDVWANLAIPKDQVSGELFDKSLDYAAAIGIALSCDN